MLKHLKQFKALEPGARRLFLEASALLPFISLSLRLRGFRATQLDLQKLIARCQSKHTKVTRLEKMTRASLTARMVRSAAYRAFGRPTCLEKSLALWWLLGRQGISSSVRIGSRKTGEKFEAHSWVECEGVALNEPEGLYKHYTVFDKAFAVLCSPK
jgi:hypothetical protein